MLDLRRQQSFFGFKKSRHFIRPVPRQSLLKSCPGGKLLSKTSPSSEGSGCNTHSPNSAIDFTFGHGSTC
jgi:hypothetical protein